MIESLLFTGSGAGEKITRSRQKRFGSATLPGAALFCLEPEPTKLVEAEVGSGTLHFRNRCRSRLKM